MTDNIEKYEDDFEVEFEDYFDDELEYIDIEDVDDIDDIFISYAEKLMEDEINIEEYIKLLKSVSRESFFRHQLASKYLALLIYVDESYISDLLPYIVSGYLYEFDECKCVMAHAYMNHLDGMAIETEVASKILNDVREKCIEERKEGDAETALAYASYEMYNLFYKGREFVGIGRIEELRNEGRELLVEAKDAIYERIEHESNAWDMFFDRRLLLLINQELEFLGE